jgi:predicted transcriptional regulator
MTEAARPSHTLSEILLDHRSTPEKVRSAAKKAPFWVIAITGHATVAFVLGMVVLRHEMTKQEAEVVVSELKTEVPDLKIEDAIEPLHEVKRTAIPANVEFADEKELA